MISKRGLKILRGPRVTIRIIKGIEVVRLAGARVEGGEDKR